MPGETDPPGRGGGWGPDGWLVQQALQRHLLQTQLTDRLLGALLRRLNRSGLYERSLVVVAADHGIGFVPGHKKRTPSSQTLGHIAPVPLFVKLPHQRRNRTSDLPVETIDVVPTVADALDVPRVWPMDGKSMLDGSIPRNRTRTINRIALDPDGAEKYELVDQKYETFGATRGVLDLFKLGPAGAEKLVGTRLNDLRIEAPDPGITVSIDFAGYESAGPDSKLFPALMEGTLDGTRRPSILIAIAVNGRVAAVTRSSLSGGRLRFSSVQSPKVFRVPPNTIELFEIKDVDSGRLVPLIRADGS